MKTPADPLLGFNWDDLRILIAIDEAGTFSAAARTLHISHSTVYRRLSAIEAALKIKIFRRQDDLLVRTDIAGSVLAQARRVEQEVAELTRSAVNADAKLEGLVRVAGPHSLVTDFVAPRMGQLRLRCPGIQVSLRAELGVDTVLKGTSDIGLRISAPVAEQLDIRRVGTAQFGLYGVPALASQASKQLRKNGTFDVDFVDFASDQPEMPETAWLRRLSGGRPPALQANANLVLQAAACAGVGLAALPCYAADASAELTRIRTEKPGPTEGVFIVTRREQRGVARVRAVVDFLAQAIAASRELFRGEPRRSR